MNTYPYTVKLLIISYLYFYITLFLISGVDAKCKTCQVCENV